MGKMVFDRVKIKIKNKLSFSVFLALKKEKKTVLPSADLKNV